MTMFVNKVRGYFQSRTKLKVKWAYSGVYLSQTLSKHATNNMRKAQTANVSVLEKGHWPLKTCKARETKTCIILSNMQRAAKTSVWAYILKVKTSADSTFQSPKICGKVRKF